MTTWIALLRGINVGGSGRLPMADLRALLESLGLRDVRTYIQSGNVVFRGKDHVADELAPRITREIAVRFGFEPALCLLTREALHDAMAANPYPEAIGTPNSLHLYFLDRPATGPDLDALEALKQDDERFSLAGSVLYLHAPKGIGRSKLAANVERHLGVPVTARNWRTISRVMELAVTE